MLKESLQKKIGSRIRHFRKSKQLTIANLAFDCNIDSRQLIRIERGEINTSIYQLYTLCEKLNIELIDLLNEFDN